MDKVKLIEFFGRKALLVILASVLLLTTVLSRAARPESGEAYKRKVIRQVAQDWIQVGVEQYRRGLCKQAEKSLLQAQEYQEHLTDAEREKLNELLQQIHINVLERERILETIRTANELVEQNRLADAKVYLGRVRGNAFLTEEERKLIIGGLKEIDNRLYGQKSGRELIPGDFSRVDSRVDSRADRQREEIAELYSRSVDFYLAGEFEKAREGFARIDNILAKKAEPSAPTKAKPVATGKPGLEETVADIKNELLDAGAERAQKAEPVTNKVGSVEATNRKRNILRSYTRAVVNDAVAKVQNYISQGEFDRAKEVVIRADQTVNRNRLHLGNSLFRRYSNDLKRLAGEIARRQSENTW